MNTLAFLFALVVFVATESDENGSLLAKHRMKRQWTGQTFQ